MPATPHHTVRPLDEPIEIRMERGGNRRPYVLTAWNQNGCVNYSLTVAGHGTPESLANLQSTGIFPGKAVLGWQDEVVAFVNAGLHKATMVR